MKRSATSASRAGKDSRRMRIVIFLKAVPPVESSLTQLCLARASLSLSLSLSLSQLDAARILIVSACISRRFSSFSLDKTAQRAGQPLNLRYWHVTPTSRRFLRLIAREFRSVSRVFSFRDLRSCLDRESPRVLSSRRCCHRVANKRSQ